MIECEARQDGEAVRLTAHGIEGLDKAAAGVGQGMRVVIEQADAVDRLKQILEREGRGRGQVILVPRLGAGQEVELRLPGGWNVSPRLMQALKVQPGVAQVLEA